MTDVASGLLLAMIRSGRPTQDEVLHFLGVLGTALFVWSLISAALFRAGVATYNRFVTEEHQTTAVSFGRAILVGCLNSGVMVVVLVVVGIGMGVLFGLAIGRFGASPDPTLIYIWQAVNWLVTLLSAWLVKSLLATAFARCRVGPAALAGAAWTLYELLVLAVFFGGLLLAIDHSGG